MKPWIADVMENQPSNKAKVDASLKVIFYAPETKDVWYITWEVWKRFVLRFFSLRFLACFDVVIIFVFCVDSWKLVQWFLQVIQGSVSSYIMRENMVMKSYIQLFKQFICCSYVFDFFHLHISVSIQLGEMFLYTLDNISLVFLFSTGIRVYTTD